MEMHKPWRSHDIELPYPILISTVLNILKGHPRKNWQSTKRRMSEQIQNINKEKKNYKKEPNRNFEGEITKLKWNVH